MTHYYPHYSHIVDILCIYGLLVGVYGGKTISGIFHTKYYYICFQEFWVQGRWYYRRQRYTQHIHRRGNKKLLNKACGCFVNYISLTDRSNFGFILESFLWIKLNIYMYIICVLQFHSYWLLENLPEQVAFITNYAIFKDNISRI